MKRLTFLAYVIAAAAFMACDSGGSGGGAEDSDSGSLALAAEPNTITPGSLSFVRVEFRQIFFDDIESSGLTLKLLIPSDLQYLTGSGALTLDRGALPLVPFYAGPAPEEIVLDQLTQHGVIEQTSAAAATDYLFIVFSLPGGLLEEDDDGTITFNLQVNSDPSTRYIFADLDRQALAAFNPAASDFDSESVLEIEIEAEEEEP